MALVGLLMRRHGGVTHSTSAAHVRIDAITHRYVTAHSTPLAHTLTQQRHRIARPLSNPTADLTVYCRSGTCGCLCVTGRSVCPCGVTHTGGRRQTAIAEAIGATRGRADGSGAVGAGPVCFARACVRRCAVALHTSGGADRNTAVVAGNAVRSLSSHTFSPSLPSLTLFVCLSVFL